MELLFVLLLIVVGPHSRAVRDRLLNNPGMSVARDGETETPFELAGRRARIRVPDEGGRTVVQVGEPAPESELTVRALPRSARAVLDASSAGPMDGVLWIEERRAGPAACPVRGDERGGPRVLRRSRRTPRHPECGDYAGRCSTYGCGERSSLRA